MLGKERLDKILEPVQKLLKRDAPWGEIVQAGVQISEQLHNEINPKVAEKNS